MNARPIVVLDACVLIPEALRDLLLSCAEEGLFRPVWQTRIEVEVFNNVKKLLIERGVEVAAATARANHVVNEMNRAFHDGRLDEAEWEHLERTMRNDLKDRHVLAAAVGADATHLVTENDRHFEGHMGGRRLMRADSFVMTLLNSSPERVVAAVKAMSKRCKNPPLTALDLAERFAGGATLPVSGAVLVELLRQDATPVEKDLRSVG